jgi:GntR family transcriptional regulator
MATVTQNLTTLDRADKLPLYRQIEEDLLMQIREGQLEAGQMLPAERELCDHYGVSRITVRHAMRELETRGYVSRQRGKGTFVSQSRIRREMGRLISFSQEMQAQGRRPGSRLLNLQHRPADSSMATLLDVDVGDPVWIVERLRLADDEIISASTYLNLPLQVYLTPLELSAETSLWALLEKKGVEIEQGETTVRAMIAGPHYAGLLGVDEGAPLLVRDGVNYAAQEHPVPVEAFEVVSRADRYQYSLHLIR